MVDGDGGLDKGDGGSSPIWVPGGWRVAEDGEEMVETDSVSLFFLFPSPPVNLFLFFSSLSLCFSSFCSISCVFIWFVLLSSLFRLLLSLSLSCRFTLSSQFPCSSPSPVLSFLLCFLHFSFRVHGLFSRFTLPSFSSIFPRPPVLCVFCLFFHRLFWVSSSLSFPIFFFSLSPLCSLIFSGFIARECQASLQLKQLQSHYYRNRSCERRRWMTSKHGVVCVMGMVIFNLVTEVLNSCNQALGKL